MDEIENNEIEFEDFLEESFFKRNHIAYAHIPNDPYKFGEQGRAYCVMEREDRTEIFVFVQKKYPFTSKIHIYRAPDDMVGEIGRSKGYVTLVKPSYEEIWDILNKHSILFPTLSLLKKGLSSAQGEEERLESLRKAQEQLTGNMIDEIIIARLFSSCIPPVSEGAAPDTSTNLQEASEFCYKNGYNEFGDLLRDMGLAQPCAKTATDIFLEIMNPFFVLPETEMTLVDSGLIFQAALGLARKDLGKVTELIKQHASSERLLFKCPQLPVMMQNFFDGLRQELDLPPQPLFAEPCHPADQPPAPRGFRLFGRRNGAAQNAGTVPR